jgi:hypothetical protein
MKINLIPKLQFVPMMTLLLLLSVSIAQAATAKPNQPQLMELLDTDWRFRPDPSDALMAKGVTGSDFDDHAWITLNAKQQWQLQPESPVADYHGVAWYRKTFKTVPNPHSQRVLLYFAGADGNAIIYLNGKKIGSHQTAGAAESYAGWNTPFYFDITDELRPKRNHLAVKVTSKPAFASGLHGGVSLWLADSSMNPFPSLLANPFWSAWITSAQGPMPAGWSIYAKDELRSQLKTARVKTADGAEGLAITFPPGTCNLFPSSASLEKPGIYHFSVQLLAKKAMSVRAKMYLPRPGEVIWEAKEAYGTTVQLSPGQPQWLRFDIPITEPNRANNLYLYLPRPDGLIVSEPSLLWSEAAEK